MINIDKMVKNKSLRPLLSIVPLGDYKQTNVIWKDLTPVRGKT